MNNEKERIELNEVNPHNTTQETHIPDRMFFKIGEVADITRLKPYVLRFWETEFKELAPQKATNKQRKYTKQEIEKLLLIKKLLYEEKFTIEGAKQKLKEMKNKKHTPVNLTHTKSKQQRQQSLNFIRNGLLDIKTEIQEYFNNKNTSLDA